MSKIQNHRQEGHFRGAGYNDPPEDHGHGGWGGVVSHAGSRLLADLADRSTLTAQLSQALAGLRRPRAVHDPGRVLVDLAVAVADGAEAISDIAVLGDQAAVFGAVASDSTCWRTLAEIGSGELAAIATGAAGARELVWAQRAGPPVPPTRRRAPPGGNCRGW